MDGRDHRLCAGFDPCDQGWQRGILGRFAEFANISAGDERAPRAGDDDAFGSRIRVGALNSLEQAAPDGHRQRVHRRLFTVTTITSPSRTWGDRD